ncbi:mediator complex subunit MED14-domain-containing protein [Sphaerosporella brunnea]|uniref:Mediator of RNA polymerase II transcription subunit 14 n=1 Tax=Sphaerosporella brunnea TaxID=1250544 RepID=A0A5J5F290_9PEZI|nr:mediator complex subunit MED14-domain-containing protein [Sphaerosporella brunnea]
MTQADSRGAPPRTINHTNSMANSTTGGGDDATASMAVTKKRTEIEVRAPKLHKITQGFVPLQQLVNRLVQDSYNELQAMVESISSAGMSSEDKKARILNYAANTRKQFIKLLVLTMWANDAAAVSDVIDLKVWLDEQYRTYDSVVAVLMEVRKVTGRARIPNPDLETAVDILSTGEPMTDVMKRYVPPPELSSAEILKILRNINAQLAVRLGLHEKLPSHFRNYTIGSGRATFTAPDEFEVDLSIGDESPESQLYVIDVRPLFEPSIRPLPPIVFRELEARGNQILSQNGLDGIYDFLHDFFLTSKITTLMRQAHEMLGGRWTENLKIQQVKRTLVIQYWPHKPAEKSWIEVGVKRGLGQKPSRLGVRWMRDNVEMKDVEVPLDVAALSAETLMKTVIAMHTKHILATLRDRLAQSALLAVPGIMTLEIHPTDSFDSYLKIQLTPSRECKVLVEPITGRFALRPPSEKAARVEYDMNGKPFNVHEALLRFKFIAMQDEVEHRARSMGWEILKSLNIRPEELKHNFPSNSRYMLYMRRKGWHKNWIITFVQQDSGESWWATEIVEKPTQWSISTAVRIPSKGDTNVTYRFMESLEKMAAALISHFVNSRELEQQNIQHRFLPSKVIGTNPLGTQIPELYVRFSSLITASWGIDVLRISFQGLATQDGHCTLVVTGRTKQPMTQLNSTNIAAEESDVSFHPQSGSYAVRFVIPVGELVIPLLVEKLHRIEKLIQFVTIIRQFNLNCLHVSLGRVVFQYSDDPELSAEISFTGEDAREMKLILPKDSPHIRIQQQLQYSLIDLGLEIVIKALRGTLPVLIAMDAIEASLPPTAQADDLHITVRDIHWFRLDYQNKKYVLDARLHPRRGTVYWRINDPAAPGNGVAVPDRVVCEDLKRLWQEEGDGWEALKTGLAVEDRAVKDVLMRCHEVIWKAPPPQPPQMQPQR